jgi:hypothetical protein
MMETGFQVHHGEIVDQVQIDYAHYRKDWITIDPKKSRGIIFPTKKDENLDLVQSTFLCGQVKKEMEDKKEVQVVKYYSNVNRFPVSDKDTDYWTPKPTTIATFMHTIVFCGQVKVSKLFMDFESDPDVAIRVGGRSAAVSNSETPIKSEMWLAIDFPIEDATKRSISLDPKDIDNLPLTNAEILNDQARVDWLIRPLTDVGAATYPYPHLIFGKSKSNASRNDVFEFEFRRYF